MIHKSESPRRIRYSASKNPAYFLTIGVRLTTQMREFSFARPSDFIGLHPSITSQSVQATLAENT